MSAAIPAVGPARAIRVPRIAERGSRAGLAMIAARMPGVPLVHVRLHLPFSGTRPAHAARAHLLASTMLLGTEERDAVRFAADLQALGGELGADADPDELVVSGSVLAPNLAGLLGLLSEVLTSAAYRAREVEGERDRMVQRLAIARSQPGVLAEEAFLARLYGSHPYASELPGPQAVREVSPAALRRLHRGSVAPACGLLVIVGDIAPHAALEAAERALEPWDSEPPFVTRDARPPAPEAHGPTLLLDRPGAAQTTIRLGTSTINRSDPAYPALDVANTIFGGYFSSRLVENIRERRGFTYSPRSSIEHMRAASRWALGADVGTEVTAPTLVEISYELGRLSTTAVEPEEVESAARYLAGVLSLATSSQSGLAWTLARLVRQGLGPEHLRTYPRRLAAVRRGDVLDAAREHLAPSRMITVLVGDAARIGGSVRALGDVTLSAPR